MIAHVFTWAHSFGHVRSYTIFACMFLLIVEMYRYGFFATFRYPILKSCKVPITDNWLLIQIGTSMQVGSTLV